MPRLVINPGTPSTWEIELKPGANLLGRGFANDFKIDHPSVSGSHCQIVVENGSAIIKDLGSTNGTYVNRAPVTEASLVAGQVIHLGGIEMMFQGDPPASATATVARTEMVPAPPLPPSTTVTPHAPPAPPGTVTVSGQCKFHPRTAGRYLCNKCRQFFCELCVATRTVPGGQKKYCRHCGTELAPVHVQIQRSVEKGFFARLPGVFIYPFKGSGLFILIIAAIVFALLDAVSSWFMILMKMMVVGYLFSYMQSIIHSTAAGDEQMAEMPPFDGLFGAFFTFAGTVAASFAIPIGLGIAKIFFEVDIPASALIATIILGCLYFPMAFLAVAMKDSVMAANPLVVVPAIFKVPLEYLVTSILLTGVFGIRELGDVLSSTAKQAGLTTRDMSTLFITFGVRIFWTLLSVYLLTVGMRILGTLYLTRKRQLAWFEH
jgi:hypothetical protein